MKQVEKFQRKIEKLCAEANTALSFSGTGDNKDGIGVNMSSIKGNIRVVDTLIDKLIETRKELCYCESESVNEIKSISVYCEHCRKRDVESKFPDNEQEKLTSNYFPNFNLIKKESDKINNILESSLLNKQEMDIMLSFTTSRIKLNLKHEEMNGIWLALERIIEKGKSNNQK